MKTVSLCPLLEEPDSSFLYVTLKNGRGVLHKLEERESKLN
jgi:hypothetical protein